MTVWRCFKSLLNQNSDCLWGSGRTGCLGKGKRELSGVKVMFLYLDRSLGYINVHLHFCIVFKFYI